MKKILLIEDEQNVAEMIKMGLEEEGYRIYMARDGSSGLKMLDQKAADLVLLDLILPDIDGLEVCRQIKERPKTVPVLMLTALGTTEHIVTGLNTGADDYLTKPFKFNELVARINALIRRLDVVNLGATTSKFVFQDICLDDEAKTVTRKNRKIDLTTTEYKLLLYLIKNTNKVVSREQILNSVWGIDFELSTNIVDVYINYLRKKLGKNKPVIHTVIGMGYVLRKDE